MIDITHVIRQRRSVREFTDKVPDEALVGDMLEAFRWAPSGLNNQPWKCMVLRDKELKEGLSQFTSYKKIVRSAPVCIIVCLDLNISYNRDKDLMAIGAAIENMLLSAYASGLGTCWLGEIINRKTELSGFLGLESGLEIMAVIAVGYPLKTPKDGERRPLEGLLIAETSRNRE
jgi:nitroreductase